jgi:hypothetical protein
MNTRPLQASPDEPHWVVVMLDPKGPVEVSQTNIRRRLFRHPSEELASAECIRLATLCPGKRFQVYASRLSCKIEPTDIAEAP